MNSTTFRRTARDKAKNLFLDWKQIECDIKQAEQISKKVPIAAINELRYCGRQLLQAVVELTHYQLTDDQKESIERRLLLADQYLKHAKHDVTDAVLNFYLKYTARLDDQYGISAIAQNYPEYPALRELVRSCAQKTVDARGSQEDRDKLYSEIHDDGFEQLTGSFQALFDAEVAAKTNLLRLETEIENLQRSEGRFKLFSIICGIATLISVPLALVLWLVNPEDVGKVYGDTTGSISSNEEVVGAPEADDASEADSTTEVDGEP